MPPKSKNKDTPINDELDQKVKQALNQPDVYDQIKETLKQRDELRKKKYVQKTVVKSEEIVSDKSKMTDEEETQLLEQFLNCVNIKTVEKSNIKLLTLSVRDDSGVVNTYM